MEALAIGGILFTELLSFVAPLHIDVDKASKGKHSRYSALARSVLICPASPLPRLGQGKAEHQVRQGRGRQTTEFYRQGKARQGKARQGW
jgi:hypothetical protein